MDSILVHFFRHNTWANLLLLNACAGLSETQLDARAVGTYGSIRDTLVHIVGAQENYLARLTGEPPQNPLRRGEPFPGVADLRERVQRTSEGLADAAGSLAPGTILTGVWRGEPYELPVEVVLLQAINHATEHRSQVAAILTQEGITPPEMDSWSYHDAMSG
jgi:uncharacterized damage-inducible protein DinB